MKNSFMRIVSTSAVIVITLFIGHRSFAQSRSSGGAVVPYGYENFDSLRFMLIDMVDPANPPYNPGMGRHFIDSLADELGATFEGNWGGILPSQPFSGKRKGVMAPSGGAGYFPFSDFIEHIKQRVYHAIPVDLVDRYNNGNGFFWRYNGANWIVLTFFVNGVLIEQQHRIHLQCFSDFGKSLETKLFLIPLDTGNVIGMEGYFTSQCLLSEVQFFAVCPDIFCNNLMNVHKTIYESIEELRYPLRG